MCNATFAELAGPLTVGLQSAGMGSSAFGAFNQASLQKRLAEQNAQMAEMAAQDALYQGQIAAHQSQRQHAQLKGSQRASLAANGVELSEGSALNLLTDSDFMKQQDTAMIQLNAARLAWGYRTQGLNYRRQAAFSNPLGAGLGSLLGSAGQVAPHWYDRYKKGVI